MPYLELAAHKQWLILYIQTGFDPYKITEEDIWLALFLAAEAGEI